MAYRSIRVRKAREAKARELLRIGEISQSEFDRASDVGFSTQKFVSSQAKSGQRSGPNLTKNKPSSKITSTRVIKDKGTERRIQTTASGEVSVQELDQGKFRETARFKSDKEDVRAGEVNIPQQDVQSFSRSEPAPSPLLANVESQVDRLEAQQQRLEARQRADPTRSVAFKLTEKDVQRRTLTPDTNILTNPNFREIYTKPEGVYLQRGPYKGVSRLPTQKEQEKIVNSPTGTEAIKTRVVIGLQDDARKNRRANILDSSRGSSDSLFTVAKEKGFKEASKGFTQGFLRGPATLARGVDKIASTLPVGVLQRSGLKVAGKFNPEAERVLEKRNISRPSNFRKAFRDEDVKITLGTAALGASSVLIPTLGIVAGAGFTGVTAVNTIRNPTPENIGEATFITGAAVLGVRSTKKASIRKKVLGAQKELTLEGDIIFPTGRKQVKSPREGVVLNQRGERFTVPTKAELKDISYVQPKTSTLFLKAEGKGFTQRSRINLADKSSKTTITKDIRSIGSLYQPRKFRGEIVTDSQGKSIATIYNPKGKKIDRFTFEGGQRFGLTEPKLLAKKESKSEFSDLKNYANVVVERSNKAFTSELKPLISKRDSARAALRFSQAEKNVAFVKSPSFERTSEFKGYSFDKGPSFEIKGVSVKPTRLKFVDFPPRNPLSTKEFTPQGIRSENIVAEVGTIQKQAAKGKIGGVIKRQRRLNFPSFNKRGQIGLNKINLDIERPKSVSLGKSFKGQKLPLFDVPTRSSFRSVTPLAGRSESFNTSIGTNITPGIVRDFSTNIKSNNLSLNQRKISSSSKNDISFKPFVVTKNRSRSSSVNRSLRNQERILDKELIKQQQRVQQRQKQRQNQLQRQVRQTPKNTFTSGFNITKRIPRVPPFIPNTSFPKKKRGKVSFGSKTPVKQPKQYRPNVYSIFGNVRGKKPRDGSGLAIRPIPLDAFDKKKKKKKKKSRRKK